MSKALYELGGLRFWSEAEIELREAFQSTVVGAVRRALTDLNPAWRFYRVEGPCLAPRAVISPAYDGDDIFVTNHIAGGENLCLRAETTHTSYEWARKIGGKMPLCVWQAGKSFRRETNDGASAAKLRFNEFWQLEFQAIYAEGSKADYREAMMSAAASVIGPFSNREVARLPSDRLPVYSESTIDLMCPFSESKWMEVASCSIRTDYAAGFRVAELAIGLDRVVELAQVG